MQNRFCPSRTARRPASIAALAVAVGALAAPGVASAANVSLNTQNTQAPYQVGSRLMINDFSQNGETNSITVKPGGGTQVVVTDSTASITSGPGCTNSSANEAVCSPDQALSDLDASLGKGNDSFTLAMGLAQRKPTALDYWDDLYIPTAFIDGGEGDDTLVGSNDIATSDSLFGAEGNDKLSGRAGDDSLVESGTDRRPGVPLYPGETIPTSGNDQLDGGEGDDYLNGGFGTDVILGASGLDTVDYGGRRSAVTVNLNPGANNSPSTGNGIAGENDSISGIENADGGRANDTLTGDSGANTLTGNSGDDTINGNAGSDRLIAGFGDDNLLAKDQTQDVVDCGPGNDKGEVDDIDVLAGSCSGKTLVVTKVAGPVAVDKTKPKLTVGKVKRKLKRKAFFKSGITGTLKSSETVSATAEMLGRFKAKKGAIAAVAGDLVLGTKGVKVGTKTVKFKVTAAKKFRKAFPRKFKVRLRVTGTDAAGNRSSKTITIRVS